MIDVVVGTSHLSEILGYTENFISWERFDAAHVEMRKRLRPILGQPVMSVSPAELSKHTVADALRLFHERAADYLWGTDPARLLTRLQRELEWFGQDGYHYPEFKASLQDAYDYLAIDRPRPHGRIVQDERDMAVFLPDFGLRVQYLARIIQGDVRVGPLATERLFTGLGRLFFVVSAYRPLTPIGRLWLYWG